MVKKGWYAHCSVCGLNYFLGRWKWVAKGTFNAMNRFCSAYPEPELDAFKFCGEEPCVITFINYKDIDEDQVLSNL